MELSWQQEVPVLEVTDTYAVSSYTLQGHSLRALLPVFIYCNPDAPVLHKT